MVMGMQVAKAETDLKSTLGTHHRLMTSPSRYGLFLLRWSRKSMFQIEPIDG